MQSWNGSKPILRHDCTIHHVMLDCFTYMRTRAYVKNTCKDKLARYRYISPEISDFNQVKCTRTYPEEEVGYKTSSLCYACALHPAVLIDSAPALRRIMISDREFRWISTLNSLNYRYLTLALRARDRGAFINSLNYLIDNDICLFHLWRIVMYVTTSTNVCSTCP